MVGTHPLLLALVVLSLGVTLAAIGQAHPVALTWLGAIAAVGAVARVVLILDRRRGAPRSIDHAALRRIDFSGRKAWLKEQVRGQDAAVGTVVDTLQRGLQLAQSGRSLGSFLLVGPTGTGKTFLATAVAHALWPQREPVVLNMNQYKSPADVSAFMGSPGADGPATEGTLTGAIAADPRRVVVLDEIDKCHPDVLHALLDALDGGRCRDKATGKTADFSACVFFATCNAGVEGLRTLADAEPKAYVAAARDVLSREAGFEKSFLARFSEIVLMDSLRPIHIAEIACLLIEKQWGDAGIQVDYLAPELLAEIVKSNEEFSQYGVRQLAHCVRRMTDGMLDTARRTGLRRVDLGLGPAAKAALLRAKSSGSAAAP